MKTAKMIRASTILAAALGLGLSFGVSPAEAHCKNKHLDAGGVCIHDIEEPNPRKFDVEIIGGDLGTQSVACLGRSERRQVRDATFPPACPEYTIDNEQTGEPEPPANLHLCAANIHRSGRPDMFLQLFFTAGVGVVGGALCPEAVYEGEFFAQFDPAHPACATSDATCVTLDTQEGLLVEKLKQPNQGAPAGPIGGFTFRTIVWIPVP